MQNKYVLWLASWYPSRVDAFNGDFIERHAKAVAQFMPVKVIFVVKDESLPPGKVEIKEEHSGAISVYRAYYNSKPGFFQRPGSGWNYISLQKKIFKTLRKQYGLPAITHVHVAFKAGIFARYLRWKYAIPYVVSEHWSGYYEGSPNSIHKTFSAKWITKRILNGAVFILPVAGALGLEIERLCATAQIVIPNVVDTSLFYYSHTVPAVTTFVHVSNMAPVKNAEAIIRAVIHLFEGGLECRLMMVGGAPEHLMSVAKASGALDQYIFFVPPLPYKQVPEYLQNTTALVLFSHFESLPCVVLEALCCGVPVIASNVGGISEVVNEKNGILVESENEEELRKAMISICHENFKRRKIAEKASRQFEYEKVGRLILDVYQKALSSGK